jgi:ferritin
MVQPVEETLHSLISTHPRQNGRQPGKYEVYAHEQKVTAMIHGLVDPAIKEKDNATFEMLRWFVKEQVEEEEHAIEIVNQIKIAGDVPGHLFCLDHHPGKRE